jgi:hypothetical protein
MFYASRFTGKDNGIPETAQDVSLYNQLGLSFHIKTGIMLSPIPQKGVSP